MSKNQSFWAVLIVKTFHFWEKSYFKLHPCYTLLKGKRSSGKIFFIIFLHFCRGGQREYMGACIGEKKFCFGRQRKGTIDPVVMQKCVFWERFHVLNLEFEVKLTQIKRFLLNSIWIGLGELLKNKKSKKLFCYFAPKTV